jgi:hypothetical protein
VAVVDRCSPGGGGPIASQTLPYRGAVVFHSCSAQTTNGATTTRHRSHELRMLMMHTRNLRHSHDDDDQFLLILTKTLRKGIKQANPRPKKIAGYNYWKQNTETTTKKSEEKTREQLLRTFPTVTYPSQRR